MDREFFVEIGCEELPAAWLPALTRQFGEQIVARLAELRLSVGATAETYSTPRRLVARVARIAERQTDLEETVTGPPVTAAFGPDGTPTPAAVGFARKQGVEVAGLARLETPRGVYLAYHKRVRGRAAIDVLPEVLGGALRALSFPKQMRWDAVLDDGKGELLFGRPIRWIVALYGSRVVAFTIDRAGNAQGPGVEPVRAGAMTYGHRFLTTSGRPGRSIKVRSFEDYRDRLGEHFVMLDRRDRQERITRDLHGQARRFNARLSPLAAGSTLLQEVPDLVEYPSVVSGSFDREFLSLPQEILTTTMIHHQHYFPVVDERGELLPTFLAVTNTVADDPEVIARNAARVLTARLRDARFFWESDRAAPVESRLERLSTVLFHKKLGTYREKAERIERLAGWIAREALGGTEADQQNAALAGRLAKTDLVTDMVREFTELQGTMGGIYAREEGLPEPIWKAIYFQYLPLGIEPTAPPTREQLGSAARAWAAVSLADKLDTLVGMLSAGERPTGSRDPFGLRRAAHGALKILVDLRELTDVSTEPPLQVLLDEAARPFKPFAEWATDQRAFFETFVRERFQFVLEQRGFDTRNVRAVVQQNLWQGMAPADARRRLEVLPDFTQSSDFRQLAVAFKRVQNIARELDKLAPQHADAVGPVGPVDNDLGALLVEPAERALLEELDQRAPIIEGVVASRGDYRQAFAEAAKFGPAVDRFFTEVFVMVEDERLKVARLRLMKRLEALILTLADVSEIVAQE